MAIRKIILHMWLAFIFVLDSTVITKGMSFHNETSSLIELFYIKYLMHTTRAQQFHL